jgi:hypothetical protein
MSLAVVALVAIACQQAVIVPTVTSTPAPVPTATVKPTEASVTAQDVQTAIVRQPTVNIRDAAGGDPTGEYVTAGQEVTILETSVDGDWVRISEPAGWVWAGCLEGLNEKGCITE